MTDPTADPAGIGSPLPETGYTLWAVLQRHSSAEFDASSAADSAQAAQGEFEAAVAALPQSEVTLRGVYDVSGLRADADVMLWLHGPTAEGLQAALRELRHTRLLESTSAVWNAMGVHRDAEFNKQHVPAFLRGLPPKRWLTVYPFVRSYEWYLLPDEERGRMLAEHGRKGAAFREVLTNTVASFALGDYEWILPLESDELSDLVDLMRDLRYTDARRHVREEVPFFTGRRITVAELAEVLR